ncbi:MAG: hypothetical protein C0454_15315 [Parvibaculum sp.]|nr:hypothetical protein [Parvibaculum sp.]
MRPAVKTILALPFFVASLLAAQAFAMAPDVAARVADITANQFKTIINCEKCDLRAANFDGHFLRLAAFQRTDLSGAMLRGAEMSGIHLTRAKLDGADLSGANLSGSDLTRTSFRNARLQRTRLDAARMHNADFTGADLRGANLRIIEFVNRLSFRDADARGAIFHHAHLASVDLTGANLSGADFTRATGLSNAQLAKACGDEKTILPPGLSIPHCAPAID